MSLNRANLASPSWRIGFQGHPINQSPNYSGRKIAAKTPFSQNTILHGIPLYCTVTADPKTDPKSNSSKHIAHWSERIIIQMSKQGDIIIREGAQVWDHELRTARALTVAGYDVVFLPKSNNSNESSPDVLLDGLIWEMKSPVSDQAKRVQRSLRRGLHRSENIIFDSRRIKKLSDAQVRRELEKWAPQLRHLKRLIYVDKH